MKYQVLVEYDAETRSYAASVPGLPVFADAESEEEAVQLAKEGLAWFLEESLKSSPPREERPTRVKLVTVDL